MRTPPLFREKVASNLKDRKKIRKDLEAGSQNVYLFRCLKKYSAPTACVMASGLGAAALIIWLILCYWPPVLDWMAGTVSSQVDCIIPDVIVGPLDQLLAYAGLPGLSTVVEKLSNVAALLIVVFFGLYLVIFPVFTVIRRIALARDKKAYKDLTGKDFSTHWDVNEQSDRPSPGKAE
jgi:hypothetical protein